MTIFFEEVPKSFGFGISGLALAVILGCLAYAPRFYEITDTSANIIRFANTVRIPIRSIREARRVEKSELKRTVRGFGVGGLFGYFGSFSNKTFGMMDWYLTDQKKVVLIRRAGRTILLSPDLPDDFLQQLSANTTKE